MFHKILESRKLFAFAEKLSKIFNSKLCGNLLTWFGYKTVSNEPFRNLELAIAKKVVLTE